MACQKHRKIPIVGDGNCLFRATSFCIYGSEDFHTEIHEKAMQNITTRWGLLKNFTILKESVVYKEYEIYYGFMVCSTGRGSAEQSGRETAQRAASVR
ncbi:hypothetical protein AVEN_147128-1 [Araneus ventricosus]|uniref:OTU domain-containing protein n=1 Tax=Araneus ventricosus TaxID=182803 RepID=A0A4Y2GE40_ARAVE|nr:hypothetical protein AVEN_147128-1 [Araneus ventricosus]